MGGSGSTRWNDHQKALLVEDALQLNVATFEPALKHDETTGILRWTNSQTGEVTAEFVFSLEPASRDGSRRLVIDSDGDRLVVVGSRLVKLGGGPPTLTENNVDHFCLQLKPISEAEIKTHLELNGIEVGDFDDRYGAQGFGNSLYIKDPEGNLVELKSQNLEGVNS